MDSKMFCFQCEQTIGDTCCTANAGACGKKSHVANLQDELTGAMIGLVRACGDNRRDERITKLLMEGIFSTLTNVNFDPDVIHDLICRVKEAKENIMSQSDFCASDYENINDYDLNQIWDAPEDIRSLKSLLLFGIRGISAYAYHSMVQGHMDLEVNEFFYNGLRYVGMDLNMEELLEVVMETGKINLKCMELLDKANVTENGTPVPTEVPLTIEAGPFIVISGHDLHDLKLLLEQTAHTGINIYTHSEMLPAHGYPQLKKHTHLKGNFGTAWWNQQKEFENIPAPILFTTNCLMPLRNSYADRVFTTSVVAYPGLIHIGQDKDFTPVIKKALELGGYKEARHFTGINGGSKVITGFAHHSVLSIADKIVNLVKAGKISHFFLIGGCDGARPGRNYYTEFAKKTPSDSIILTLACGKFRINDLDLGEIEGIPRILDIGQCNDAYSAIRIALALADAFSCQVNDLPLTMILSWYEQKAVAILLTLLYLGIQNMFLGPTIPAFLSPNVLNHLMEHYNLSPISTPEEDLKKVLG